MRNLLAALLAAIVIVALVLLIAGVAALGVAGIGWLLWRWFGLTQWQGTVIAAVLAAGIAWLVYKLVGDSVSPAVWQSPYESWDQTPESVEEPKVVAWRSRRPTPGDLPSRKRKPPSERPG